MFSAQIEVRFSDGSVEFFLLDEALGEIGVGMPIFLTDEETQEFVVLVNRKETRRGPIDEMWQAEADSIEWVIQVVAHHQDMWRQEVLEAGYDFEEVRDAMERFEAIAVAVYDHLHALWEVLVDGGGKIAGRKEVSAETLRFFESFMESLKGKKYFSCSDSMSAVLTNDREESPFSESYVLSH